MDGLSEPLIGSHYALVWWFDGARLRIAHIDTKPNLISRRRAKKARWKFQREQKQQKEEL